MAADSYYYAGGKRIPLELDPEHVVIDVGVVESKEGKRPDPATVEGAEELRSGRRRPRKFLGNAVGEALRRQEFSGCSSGAHELDGIVGRQAHDTAWIGVDEFAVDREPAVESHVCTFHVV